MSRSIRLRIVVPYLILVALTMLVLNLYTSNLLRQVYLDEKEAQLLAEARLLADEALPALSGEKADDLDLQARRWSELLEARVTIIGIDGAVLGESHEDRKQMDNHLYRPEVQQALSAGQGSSVRFSDTGDQEMIYLSALVSSEGRKVGVVRVALPLQRIETQVAGQLRDAFLKATLLAALVAALLAVFIAERIARPVRQLTQAVEQVAEGDLSVRLLPITKDEFGKLTHAFNYMAEQLREKVTSQSREQSRLAATLEHMADGVVITDGAGTVRLINPAAARLLGVGQAKALNRPFAQVALQHQLIELWKRCREQGEEQTQTVEMTHQGLFLQTIVTPFQEADRWGYLVILQDLTQVRRLEIVRRDFVSNISHELRTPLAALKALVETLRDGAMDDPPAAARFLNRIETEVDSLTQMVQELLELSRIESGKVPLRLLPTDVADLVLIPAERLRPQAERAGLSISVDLPADLPPVMADLERAQQVVTNLVHNAIKFTQPGGQVAIRAEPVGREVLVSVRDTGVGIPAEDLPRIFERFYKADRARSGGGTGLGLSIAQHTIQAHGGRIWAESVEGEGSTFYFSLPLARKDNPQRNS